MTQSTFLIVRISSNLKSVSYIHTLTYFIFYNDFNDEHLQEIHIIKVSQMLFERHLRFKINER